MKAKAMFSPENKAITADENKEQQRGSKRATTMKPFPDQNNSGKALSPTDTRRRKGKR
jgi:hypothetical protein